MTNHPNRGKNPETPGRTPRPHEVKEARAARGLTQEASAKVIHVALQTWQRWEQGDRKMHPAMWELYLSKTTVLPVEAPKPPPADETPPEGE